MKTPNYLIVTIMSDDRVSVDVEVKIPRGGELHLALGNNESDSFRMNLPKGCPRDQKRFVAIPNGNMIPAKHDEEWL